MDIQEGGRHDRYSPALPPLEAWKDPEAWLDMKTGLPKTTISLIPPVLDERGFVVIDAFVDRIESELFHDGIAWSRDLQNYETRTDDHHFYFTEEEYSRAANNGNEIPKRFRELPINIGRMQRQRHNVIHAFAEKPAMPKTEDMRDYIRTYNMAHMAFKRLYVTANETVSLMSSFTQRRTSIANKLVIPSDDDDRVGEEYLKSTFSRHYDRYTEAVEIFKETENKDIFYKGHEAIKITRPTVVARKFGSIVSRKVVVIDRGIQAA